MPLWYFAGNLSENEDSDSDSEENLIFDESSDEEHLKSLNGTNGHPTSSKKVVQWNFLIYDNKWNLIVTLFDYNFRHPNEWYHEWPY